MSNIIRIKRRLSTNDSPTLPTLEHGELFYNEYSNTFYYAASSNTTGLIEPKAVAGNGIYATSEYVQTNFLNLTGGQINGSLTVRDNLTVLGDITTVNTDVITTSAFVITNYSEATPGLTVTQAGSGADIAIFKDLDDTTNVESTVFAIKNNGLVGVNTDAPTEALTVVGNISATGAIYAAGALNIDGGGSNTTLFVTDSKVGINTEEPAEALSVDGNLTVTGYLSGNGASASVLYNFIIDGGTY
jgi:hypothetical protein